MEGKYSIELFRDGGEGAGIEKILIRHDSLNVARALYKVAALNCSERLVMLCDVLAYWRAAIGPTLCRKLESGVPYFERQIAGLSGPNLPRPRASLIARNRMAVRITAGCAASAACGASACAVFSAACATLPQSTAAPLGKL